MHDSNDAAAAHLENLPRIEIAWPNCMLHILIQYTAVLMYSSTVSLSAGGELALAGDDLYYSLGYK